MLGAQVADDLPAGNQHGGQAEQRKCRADNNEGPERAVFFACHRVLIVGDARCSLCRPLVAVDGQLAPIFLAAPASGREIFSFGKISGAVSCPETAPAQSGGNSLRGNRHERHHSAFRATCE
jgi:hypothetical protein